MEEAGRDGKGALPEATFGTRLRGMTAQLRKAMAEAEARLDPVAQDELAHVIESFTLNRTAELELTEAEWELLRRVDAEPFEPADPAEVEALFARARG